MITLCFTTYGQDYFSFVGNIKDDVKEEINNSTPYFNNQKVVYYKGNKHCYLDEHMRKGFQGKVWCWVNDELKIKSIMSNDTRDYIDSISNQYSFDLNNIKCYKIKESENDKFLNVDYLNKHKYGFFMFEKTYDCTENRTYQNFRGNLRLKKNSKIYISYMKSFGGVYEQLKIYLIN